MKKINNRDAKRIKNHLEKARSIINAAQEASDDGEICMSIDIAEDCVSHLDEILIAINNTFLN